MTTKRYFVALLAFATLTSSFFIPYAGHSQIAGVGGAGAPIPCAPGKLCFGGKIAQTDVCTCPVNGVYFWMQVIGPPRGLEIVLDFTVPSLIYLNYALKNGVWTKGDTLPVRKTCQDIQCGRKGCYCVGTQSGYPVIHIGTTAGEGAGGGGGGFGGGGASGGF